MPIFCRKNVHSHENTWLSYIFFHLVVLEKPPVGKPLFGHKKRRLCQNYTIIWAKKVHGMPFFPIFYEKITAPIPMICQKDVHSLKKHIALMPVFCRKNVQSFKNTVLSCHFFFKFEMKNLAAVMPISYLIEKTSIQSKLHNIMDQKS